MLSMTAMLITKYVNVAFYIFLCFFQNGVADSLDYLLKIPPPNNILRQFTCAYIYEDDVPYRAIDSEESESNHPTRLLRKVDDKHAGYLEEDVEDSTNYMYGFKHLVEAMRQAVKEDSAKSIEYSKSNIKNDIQRLIDDGKNIRDVRAVNIGLKQSISNGTKVRDVRALNIDLKQSIGDGMNTRNQSSVNRNVLPVELRIFQSRAVKPEKDNGIRKNRMSLSHPGGPKTMMNNKFGGLVDTDLGKHNRPIDFNRQNTANHPNKPLFPNRMLVPLTPPQSVDILTNEIHGHVNGGQNSIQAAPLNLNPINNNNNNNQIQNNLLREINPNNSLTSINMLPSSMNQPLPRIVTNINENSTVNHDNVLQHNLPTNNGTVSFNVANRISSNLLENNEMNTINSTGISSDELVQQRLQKEIQNNIMKNPTDKIQYTKSNKHILNNNNLGGNIDIILSNKMNSRLLNIGMDDRINNLIGTYLNKTNMINDDNDTTLLAYNDNGTIMSSQKNNIKKINKNFKNNEVSDIVAVNNSLVGYLWTTINRFNRNGAFQKPVKTGFNNNYSVHNYYASTRVPKVPNALLQKTKFEDGQLLNNLVVNMTLTDEVKINGTLNFNYDDKNNNNNDNDNGQRTTQNNDDITLATVSNSVNNNNNEDGTSIITTINNMSPSNDATTIFSSSEACGTTPSSCDNIPNDSQVSDQSALTSSSGNDISIRDSSLTVPQPVTASPGGAISEVTGVYLTTCINVTRFRFFYNNNVQDSLGKQKVLNLDIFDPKNLVSQDVMANDSLFNMSPIMFDKTVSKNSGQQVMKNRSSFKEVQLNSNADRKVKAPDITEEKQPGSSAKKIERKNEDYEEDKLV